MRVHFIASLEQVAHSNTPALSPLGRMKRVAQGICILLDTVYKACARDDRMTKTKNKSASKSLYQTVPHNLLTEQPNYVRSLRDAAGVVPFLVGAFPGRSLRNNALYMEQTIFKYQPPQINLKSGAWKCWTGDISARLAHAMKEARLSASDLLLCPFNAEDSQGSQAGLQSKSVYTALGAKGESNASSQHSETLLVSTLRYLAYIENKLISDLSSKKDNISKVNALMRTQIAGEMRQLTSPENSDEFINQLSDMMKHAKIERERKLEKVPLVQSSVVESQSFWGLSHLQSFYDSSILNYDSEREAMVSENTTAEKNELEYFEWIVSMYHQYYEGVMNSLPKGKDVHGTWMEIASPTQHYAETIDSMQHRINAKHIVSGFVWKILLERFEITSNIVYHYFMAFVGAGSDVLFDMTKLLAESIITSSMAFLFCSSSVNANPIERSQPLPEKVNNETETIKKTITNFIEFKGKFDRDFSTFLSYVIPQEQQILKNPHSADARELHQNIIKALMDTTLFPSQLKKDAVIYKLHSSIVCKNISDACKERFGGEQSPRNWLSAVNTTLEIRQFVPYAQYNALRNHVYSKLGELKPEVWAAAIVHTLNYKDGCYISRFHRSAFLDAFSSGNNPYDIANTYMILINHPLTRHLDKARYNTTIIGPFLGNFNYREYNNKQFRDTLNELFSLDQKQFEHAPKKTNPPQKKPTPQTPKKDAKSGQSQPKKQKGGKPATPGKPGNSKSNKGKKGKK